MTKKYVIYRVPIDADKGFKDKKRKIEADISRWTGKPITIPMTKILRVVATTPVEIGEANLFRLVKKKKIKKIRSLVI